MSDDHVMEDDGEEEAAEQETPDSAEWQAGEGELVSEGMCKDTVNCTHKFCNRLCRKTDLLIQFMKPHQVLLTLFPLPIMLLSSVSRILHVLVPVLFKYRLWYQRQRRRDRWQP